MWSSPLAQWNLHVETPPALAASARAIENVDPEPLTQALERAGLRLPETVHVVLIANGDRRAERTAPWIVGQAFGVSDLVIFPERVSSYPYDSLETVFRHELVHLALSSAAGEGDLPRWFHEGVATSIESPWGVDDSARLLLAAAGGPDVAEVSRLFRSDNRPETTTAYLLAAALVDDVRRRHGADLPGLIATDVAGGLSFDAAFAQHTGETPDQAATVAWATYRRLSTWLPFVTSVNAVWTLILGLAFLAFVMRLRQRALRRRRWDEEDGGSETEPPPTIH
ncbi:MAG: hypothetical protein AB7F99_03290 [Vicinamibacterales bacterium]